MDDVAQRVTKLVGSVEWNEDQSPSSSDLERWMRPWKRKVRSAPGQWTIAHTTWWSVNLLVCSVWLAFGLPLPNTTGALGLVAVGLVTLSGLAGIIFLVGWFCETTEQYGDDDPFYLKKRITPEAVSMPAGVLLDRGVGAAAKVLKSTESRQQRRQVRRAVRELRTLVHDEAMVRTAAEGVGSAGVSEVDIVLVEQGHDDMMREIAGLVVALEDLAVTAEVEAMQRAARARVQVAVNRSVKGCSSSTRVLREQVDSRRALLDASSEVTEADRL